MMLASQNRLKSSKQIEKVFRNGKSTRSGFLFLKYFPNQLEISRIAFSVGIKFSKKAVDRNRAKRMLREETRRHMPNIKKGFDIVVFLGNVSPKDFTKDLVGENLKNLFIRSNLIKQ